MIYTVTLNPSLDYVMECGGIKEGNLNRSREENFFAGGKGINVSAMLSNLGVENTAVCFAAGFTGKQLEEMIKKRHKTKFFYIGSGYTRINVKIKGETETEINGAGPTADREAVDGLLSFMEGLTQKDTVIISGSQPKSEAGDIYEKAAGILYKNGVSFTLDTYGKSLRNALKYRPFLIKPNRDELEELFNKKADGTEGITALASQLQKEGAKNVLVSMGEKGAVMVCHDGNIYSSAAPKGKKINTVGSGDSMVAGFTAQYIKHGDYKKAFYMAVAAGSATAFSENIASGGEVLDIYNRIYRE